MSLLSEIYFHLLTDLVLFNPKRKQATKYFKFRTSGQKIGISNRKKYLGIQVEKHCNWNDHIKNIISS